MTKYYGGLLAVDKLNLGVQRGQTFGLLGVNGAGKTTTFKMLTGDIPVSSGDAFIYSNSVRNEIKKVHSNLGYCPQFDGIIGEMTGRETLRMFARLRGIQEKEIDDLADALAESLIFTQHIDKQVQTYRYRKWKTAFTKFHSRKTTSPNTGFPRSKFNFKYFKSLFLMIPKLYLTSV